MLNFYLKTIQIMNLLQYCCIQDQALIRTCQFKVQTTVKDHTVITILSNKIPAVSLCLLIKRLSSIHTFTQWVESPVSKDNQIKILDKRIATKRLKLRVKESIVVENLYKRIQGINT